MTISRRSLYIGLGSLVAAIILFWAGYTRGLSDAAQRASVAASGAILTQSKAEASATSVQTAHRADAQPDFIASETSLNEAVASNSAWGDTPLPADVRDSLRKR